MTRCARNEPDREKNPVIAMTLLLTPSGNDVNDHDEELEYYRRRAAEELEKARRAETPSLASKHRQLSSIYASRALQAERRNELNGARDEES